MRGGRRAEGDFWLIKLSHANDWLLFVMFRENIVLYEFEHKIDLENFFFFCVRNRANKAVGLCIHAIWLDFTIFKQFETENKKNSNGSSNNNHSSHHWSSVYMNACALIQLNERRHENSMAENERKRKKIWKELEKTLNQIHTHTRRSCASMWCANKWTNEQLAWLWVQICVLYTDSRHTTCEMWMFTGCSFSCTICDESNIIIILIFIFKPRTHTHETYKNKIKN